MQCIHLPHTCTCYVQWFMSVTYVCAGEEPSAELLRLSSPGSSVLDPPGDAVGSDLRVARRDVASLLAGMRGLPGRAPTVAVRRVVNHQHGGVHPGQRVHAALAGRVEPRGAQLQLIVAGHLDERTPAERSLEARSKPGGQTRRTDAEL